MATDQSVPDIEWWFSEFAEFEDFVGIGEERTLALAAELDKVNYPQVIIERLLRANKVPLEKYFAYAGVPIPPKPEKQPDRAINLDDEAVAFASEAAMRRPS